MLLVGEIHILFLSGALTNDGVGEGLYLGIMKWNALCVNFALSPKEVLSLTSMITWGLSILGKIWSPQERVNCNPLNPSDQLLISTGTFCESTKTGVAVLALLPLATVLICNKV